MRLNRLCGAVIALGLCLATAAQAADTLTVASVGGSTAWDFSVIDFGKRMGFFAKNGIEVEVATTDNTAASLQALIAGSADIGIVGVTAYIGATLKGAPVKMISSSFTGASDWLWYVRADSPIKSFKDITEKTTIGVNDKGTSQYIILSALLEQYGVKPNVVAVGNTAAGMTQVMTGQIDIGTDGNGLLGAPQLAKGEVRPVAYGREVEIMRGVTVRGLAVREDTLVKRRELIVRFLKAYQATVDWMYRDPKAVAWFAEAAQSSHEDAERVKTEMYPESAMKVGEVIGVDISVKQGVQFKRLTRAPTAEEIAKMFETVWTPAM